MDARTDGAPRVVAPRIRVPGVSANTRFKQGARRRQALSLAAAVLVHGLIFYFGPTWRTPATSAEYVRPAEMRSIVLAPEVEMPAEPEPIEAPAVPILGRVELTEEIRLEPVKLDADPQLPGIPEPPPVPASAGSELAAYEYFMPYMVRPELKNRQAVKRELERRYPNVLRRGNVEGAVLVVFWIDEFGTVQKYEIRRSSGSKALDAAVEGVIEMMEFRPAMSRGKPIKVIVALPIRFQLY